MNKSINIEQLSKTELTIVKLIAQGLTSKEIAKMKTISLRTVEKHRGNIIAKLKIPKNTNSLTKWAMLNKNLFV